MKTNKLQNARLVTQMQGNGTDIPDLTFCSDRFKCNECGYVEMRRVLGNISITPCPKCGHSPLYRI